MLSGTIALLGQSRAAVPLALATVVVMVGCMFLATDIVRAQGVASSVGFPAAIAVFQHWLARHAAVRGWIG